MPNRRSEAALGYRRLYHSVAWRQRRARQLRAQPWCAMCAAQGRHTVASVADHVVPHRGDAALFWSGELQSLCMSCHSAAKQQIEGIGYSTTVGQDGWPTDPKHYANTGRIGS